MITPEDVWALPDKYYDSYSSKVAIGIEEAKRRKVVFVAIARNCMPYLTNTLACIDAVAAHCGDAAMYVFENDSDDGTAEILDEYASTRSTVVIEHATLNRPRLCGFEVDRTMALAEYRNKCRDWVEANHQDAGYVVVLDLDPHGGFSPTGVFNSIGWICDQLSRVTKSMDVGGMASYSLVTFEQEDGTFRVAQYDAWAARLCWFEDLRDVIGMQWFHQLMPPVGSPPFVMYSAFGGLAVYTLKGFLAGRYVGGDCEHVGHAKSMWEGGYQLWFNPGCRYYAVKT